MGHIRGGDTQIFHEGDTFAVLTKGDFSPGDIEEVSRCIFGGSVPVFSRDSSLLDILVHFGIFPSKGQARKNWKGDIAIPDGLNVWRAVGKKKLDLWIHKIPAGCLPFRQEGTLKAILAATGELTRALNA